MTRRDVEFDAEGVTLRGWFYPAEGAVGTAPTIVMAHGFSAVKEMYLDKYAELFSGNGPCPGRRRHRPPRQGRCRAGAAGQRV